MRLRVGSLLLFSALLLGTKSVGQDRGATSITETSGFPNGRAWQEFTEADKVQYLMGFFNGIVAATSAAEDYVAPMNKEKAELIRNLADRGLIVQVPPPEGERPKPYPTIKESIALTYFGNERATIGDAKYELDKLYSERENALLPIPAALQYCAVKLQGVKTSAELEQFLIKLRRAYFSADEKK